MSSGDKQNYEDCQTKTGKDYENTENEAGKDNEKTKTEAEQHYEEFEIKAKPVEKPIRYLEDEITYSNLQVSLIVFLSLLMCYVIYEHEYMHILALRFYANVGDQDAQHILGQRYYLGKGVLRDKKAAFYWFKEASKQGNAYSSYNLAVAHLQGFHRLDRKGEAHDLIKHAASSGIKDAERLLKTACAKGDCDR